MNESTEAKIAIHNWTVPIYAGFADVTFFNHAGTHYDPPSHLIVGAANADDEPLEKFVGPGVYLDLRQRALGEELRRSDFENRVPAHTFVVVLVNSTKDDCAYLGGEAAEYLARLPIRGYATNAWTIANPKQFPKVKALRNSGQMADSRALFPEHHALLSRDIPNIEGLTNLEALAGQKEFLFVGLPIKVEKGTGAPVRAAAFLY